MGAPAAHLLLTSITSLLFHFYMRTHVEVIEEWSNCRIWDVESGKEKAKLEGHTNRVTSVAISSDGKTIVSGSWDTTIR